MREQDRIEEHEPVAIVITFRPNFTDTLASAQIVSGVGDRCHRDLLWRGRLSLSRDDLAGLRPRRVALLLADRLHEQWAQDVRAEMQAQSDAGVHVRLVEPPAPPEGVTGAALHNVPLPGL